MLRLSDGYSPASTPFASDGLPFGSVTPARSARTALRSPARRGVSGTERFRFSDAGATPGNWILTLAELRGAPVSTGASCADGAADASPATHTLEALQRVPPGPRANCYFHVAVENAGSPNLTLTVLTCQRAP